MAASRAAMTEWLNDTQFFTREFADGFVIRLAVRRAQVHACDQNPLRRLVTRELTTHMGAQIAFVERSTARQHHYTRDGLSPFLVGHAKHQGIIHRRMRLQRLLDLFGKHFSPAVLMQLLPRPRSVTEPSASTRAKSPGTT